jgi:hypothetical protein
MTHIIFNLNLIVMKIKLKKGLTFNKEAISKLNEDQLSLIKGGLKARGSNGPRCSCDSGSCNDSTLVG